MEIVRHNKPESIWLFDYTSLEAMDDCDERLVLMSERSMNIVWQAILNIDRFRSRVFVDREGNSYNIVDDEQFSTFQGWVSDVNIQLGAFSMCNDLLQSIADSLAAMADRDCCPTSPGTGGSRGSGNIEQPANPYNQEETPDTPPPGFEDMTAFNSHKCDAAEDLLNALKGDLLGLSALSYAGSTTSAIVVLVTGLLLTPLPGGVLLDLAAYLVYSAVSYSFLAQASSIIGDNQNEYRCILYGSPDVDSAKSNLLDAISAQINADISPEANAIWTIGAVQYFMVNDAFNRLFEDTGTISQGASCSGCGDCPDPITTIWEDCQDTAFDVDDTITAINGTTCGLSGTGTYRVYARFNHDGSDWIGNAVKPVVTLVSGEIEGGGFTAESTPVNGWGYYNQAGEVIGEFEEQQIDLCCGFMLILSQSPFSVSFNT